MMEQEFPNTNMVKGVILIGTPQKGTRFRPLSFDFPKPLFPIAGIPVIQHHIEAFVKIPNLKEVILLGMYPTSEMAMFVTSMMQEYEITIRYLQEYTSLGTAGGIYHFRDQILAGDPEAFFVMNGDVCADFPLAEMIQFNKNKDNSLITVLATESTRTQSMNYGCIVENKNNHEILHYVEKPSTFVSTLINCGVYLFSPKIFPFLADIFRKKQHERSCLGVLNEEIYLEKDVLKHLAGTGLIHVRRTLNWWTQMKTAASAIYANQHYLKLYHVSHPERLTSSESSGPVIVGDVYIHPSARIHPTAKLGPNVSIGANVVVHEGVRIRESIILRNVVIRAHSLVLYSIVGWNSTIGSWTRIEGTPCDPNPNKLFAKMENTSLFSSDGRLNPSICILGSSVHVTAEVVILNSIILPHKEIAHSFKNEIIL